MAGFSFPVDKMYGAVGIFAYIMPIRYYFLIYADQALGGLPLYYSRFYYIAMLVMLLLPLEYVAGVAPSAPPLPASGICTINSKCYEMVSQSVSCMA